MGEPTVSVASAGRRLREPSGGSRRRGDFLEQAAEDEGEEGDEEEGLKMD
jgi:hypothetical protein